MFNKVITAQYFLWYVTLLPMIMVNSRIVKSHRLFGCFLLFLFVFFDASWCRQAYLFEFLGEHVFSYIQYINYAWFWYTLYIVRTFIVYADFTVTKCITEDVTLREKKVK